MSTEERKGEETARGAADDERERRREGAGSSGAPDFDEGDPREEEGWSQPEASTQKGATRAPEDGGSGEG